MVVQEPAGGTAPYLSALRASRRLTAAQWTTVLSLVLATLAATLSGHSANTSILTPNLPIGWLAAAVGVIFFFGELFLMNVEFRRQAHSLTLAGVPLILGVLLLPPWLVVVARLAGSLVAFGYQRIALDKVLYNCAAYTFEVAVDVAVLQVFLSADSTLTLRTAAVVVSVVAVVDQLMSSFVLLLIRLHNGPLSRRDVVGVLAPAAALSLVVSVFGLAAILLFDRGAVGAIVVVVLTGVGMIGYRAHASTRQRHQALTLVHEFVAGGVGAESLESLAEVLLSRICKILRGTTAQLMLLDAATAHDRGATTSPGPAARVLSIDEDGRLTSTENEIDSADWVLVRAVFSKQPLLAARGTKDRAVRSWLSERGLRDAVVVPLPDSAGLVGTLTVTDRLGDTASFTTDDLTMLQTLAGHLAVAVRSTRLVVKLGFDATHDSLTGLVNRAYLVDQITEVLSQPAPSAAVLLLDLDRFKEVNDILGHDVGDRLLTVVGERLTACVPMSATVARLGGDEFAVLLPHGVTDAGIVTELAERIADALAQPVAFEEAMLTPEASIGIAMTNPADAHAELLRQADTAMYEAKSQDCRVVVYHPEMDRGRIERLAMLADLRVALSTHPEQFVLQYQPKMDLATRRVTGAEALVRWNHPRFGILSPDQFIPLAESTNLIEQLTPLVLGTALADCATWPRELSVAVNLSARNISDPTLPQRVSDSLLAAGVAADRLILEITESSVMGDPAQTLPVLKQLHDLGLCLSLDDFGTGYSSLSYLQRLPVGEVKIDKSFVVGLADDDQGSSRALIRSIAGLCANLGLRIVAEGIEDEQTRRTLLELGCDTGQGFYFSRPLPPEEFRTWLAASLTTSRSPIRLLSAIG